MNVEQIRAEYIDHMGSDHKVVNAAARLEIESLKAQSAARPTPPHLEAMERAWLWMENQADAQSKGGHATFDLMMLREERDALRAAIDVAAPPTAQAEGWRLIATAPKDGTYLLLWEQYSTNPFVGCWAFGSWTVSHEHVDAEGGWDGANVVDALSMPITHWMPLPPPPTSAEGGSRGDRVRFADYVTTLSAGQATAAQQPGTAYATRPEEREAFEAMMRSQTFDSLKRLSDGSYESYEARVGWLAWNVRASHGQAPAREAPAAQGDALDAAYAALPKAAVQLAPAGDMAKLRGQRMVLCSLLGECLPVIDAMLQMPGDDDSDAHLNGLAGRITGALDAVAEEQVKGGES